MSEINAIRKELTFQLSGDVSDESAQSIGKNIVENILSFRFCVSARAINYFQSY
ncbi:hypothetical protein ACYULU_08580 [Breznakiellaceae bacterium SP9]